MSQDNCPICMGLKEGAFKVAYEDKDFAVIMHPRPAAIAHALVIPKEHFAIMEQVPDPIIGRAMTLANKVSMAVFDSVGAQGSNILINNGISGGQDYNHFVINVLPRFQNDSVNLKWQPRQLGEEEMSTVELVYKEQAKNIGGFEKEQKKPIELKDTAEKISHPKVPGETNYLIRQLRRIP